MQILDSVASTMDAARENLQEGRVQFDAEGRATPLGVATHEQRSGRGQRGRTWYAPRDSSLCVTYYCRRERISPATAGELAFVAGVAVATLVARKTNQEARKEGTGNREQGTGKCADTYSEEQSLLNSRTLVTKSHPSPSEDLIFGDMAPAGVISPSSKSRRGAGGEVGLKWPNDILLNGKKMGGVLIEMVEMPAPAGASQTEKDWVALIGVGLNLNVREFPEEIAHLATSFVLEGLPETSWEPLGEQIGEELDRYVSLWQQEGLSAILALWQRFDETRGRLYTTTLNGYEVIGTADGITPEGALLLSLPEGGMVAVQSASSLRESQP